MNPYLFLVFCAVLIYLVPATFILLRNRRELEELNIRHSNSNNTNYSKPNISVCIPARNEEKTICRNLKHLINQDYNNFSIWILDDESTDQTANIVKSFQNQYPNLITVIRGDPLPEGWLGKNWACHQLSRQCGGDWLLFIDADVWLASNALSSMAKRIEQYSLDAITVWPKQHFYTFAENLLLPLMYYALLSVLPAIYVYRAPRWIPSRLRNKFAPMFSAACGQFFAFRRDPYEAVGGHSSVRDRVVEDVALAHLIKMRGFRIKMFHGNPAVHCRMYSNEREIRQGFRKNFLAGFNYNIPVFMLSSIVHLLVYVAPFILLPYTLWIPDHFLLNLGFLLSIVLIFSHRLLLSFWFNWPIWPILLHPLAVMWYQVLGIITIWDYLKGKTTNWKGRKVTSQ